MVRKLFFILILVLPGAVQAQFPPDPGDTTHRDTVYLMSPAEMTEVMRLPVFRRPESELIHIMPHQRYHFNVVMDVELNFGGTSRYAGLFFNTTDGYIGFTPPQPIEARDVLFPEIEDFTLTVISYKLGKIYTYRNRKASGEAPMQHLVSTSNTENHDYFDGNLMVSAPISNKNVTRNFCNGQYRGTLYKQDGLQTVWYLYSDEFGNHRTMPSSVQIQKYIGGWGVGFVQTSKGKFIVMEKSGNGSSYVRVVDIRPTIESFDPSDYKLMEQEFLTKGNQHLNEERENIARDEAKIAHHDHCQSEEMAIIQYRKANLERQERNLQISQSGNLIQNRDAQGVYLSLMDPLIKVDGEILETRLSICQSEYSLQQHPGDQRLSGKISCKRQLLSRLEQAKEQMQQIDHQYSNIVEANGRKARILMQVQARGGCD